MEGQGFILLTREITVAGVSLYGQACLLPGTEYILHKHHGMDEGIDEWEDRERFWRGMWGGFTVFVETLGVEI